MKGKKSLFAIDSDEDDNPRSKVEGTSHRTECSTSAIHNSDDESQRQVEGDLIKGSSEDVEAGTEGVEEENDILTTTSDSHSSAETVQPLTSFQKAKMERNRQRALLLRQARLQAHPYKKYAYYLVCSKWKYHISPILSSDGAEHQSVIRVQNSRLIDSGGGFLIEEKDLEEEQSKEVCMNKSINN